MTKCDYCGEDRVQVIGFPHPREMEVKIMCSECMESMEEQMLIEDEQKGENEFSKDL